jgi:hypothetical protein
LDGSRHAPAPIGEQAHINVRARDVRLEHDWVLPQIGPGFHDGSPLIEGAGPLDPKACLTLGGLDERWRLD